METKWEGVLGNWLCRSINRTQTRPHLHAHSSPHLHKTNREFQVYKGSAFWWWWWPRVRAYTCECVYSVVYGKLIK